MSELLDFCSVHLLSLRRVSPLKGITTNVGSIVYSPIECVGDDEAER